MTLLNLRHKVTFTTTHLSKYIVSAEELVETFRDVSADTWYSETVEWCALNGITDGIGNNMFAPGTVCTRSQIVTFLYRLAGEPAIPKGTVNPFTDVAEDAFYYDAR